jgi:hypothetical protein
VTNPGSLRPLPPAVQIHTGDKIVFRFAHLQQEKENVLSFDTSPISNRLGTEISGMFGFDLLGLLVMRIDYRDGLMSFEVLSGPGLSAHTIGLGAPSSTVARQA